jgi:hypothetical protein
VRRLRPHTTRAKALAGVAIAVSGLLGFQIFNVTLFGGPEPVTQSDFDRLTEDLVRESTVPTAKFGNGRLRFMATVAPKWTGYYEPQIEVTAGNRFYMTGGVENSGNADVADVIIGFDLPPEVDYEEDSLQWNSSYTGKEWTPVSSYSMPGTGLNISGYGPGGTAFVRLAFRLPEEAFRCGVTTVPIGIFVKLEAEDRTAHVDASVRVIKEC